MIPRLDAFEEQLPHIELEILTSDRLIDLSREEIDLSVRYGPGGWDGLVSTELAKGVLGAGLRSGAACTAQATMMWLRWFLRHGAFRSFQIMSGAVWAEATGIDLSDAKSAFIIEDFVVVIAAVMAGQGLALLPEILIREYLADGRMVLFSQTPVAWGQTYHIAHKPNAERRAIVRDVIDWLKRETAKGPVDF